MNLSASLLADHRTRALLYGTGALGSLIVEVTEETLVRHGEALEHAIGTLRERGLRVAVDDVGVGCSGLGQIATLRPTCVKLDRGLVREIDREPARVALVQALTEYARATQGLLVAEGVETVEELAHVRAAGAPLVQGFLLGRPGPPWPDFDRRALRHPPVALAG